jgi:transcriptional regulator with XRE-family HTH domain
MVKRYQPLLALRLGQNIAFFRHRAGLTQEQLAERLGVEIATLSRYETGSTLPSLVTLESIATLLRTTISALLAEAPPKRSKEDESLLAMLEPLSHADKQLALNLLATIVKFLHNKNNKK